MSKTMIALVVLLTLLLLNVPGNAQDGVIYGCYAMSGHIRIVNSPSECRNNETPISWN